MLQESQSGLFFYVALYIWLCSAQQCFPLIFEVISVVGDY